MAFLSINAVGAATGALQLAERRLADFEAERADMLKAADAEPDFEKGLALRNKVPDLDRMIDQAKIAIEHARRNLEAAKEAEAEAAIDAQGKAADRDAREAEKLTREIGPDAQRLAAKLSRLNELNASVEAYNMVRGARPFIQDGEARVREVPKKHFPTVWETLTVWVDPKTGRRPSQYRKVEGEMVPADHNGAYVKTTEKVVSRNEYTVAAHFPGGRFTDGFKLIGPKGEKLFPAGR